MSGRHHAPSVYNALKTGARLLVDAVGGVDAAASCSRTTRSMASEYGSLSSVRYMPADVVLDLETVAGRPHLTAALARAQGFSLVPAGPRGAGELAAKLAEIGRDVAELFATAATALGHATPTERERADLQRELDLVAQVATEARCLLDAGPDDAAA